MTERHCVEQEPTGSSFRSSIRLRTVLSLAALLPCLAVQGAAAEPAPEPFEWNAFVGPFHVVLLHFPIGFIMAAAGLEVFAWKRASSDLRLGARILLWFAFVAGVVASVAGLFRASEGGFDPEMTLEHRNHAFAFVGSTLLAAIASTLSARPNSGRRSKIAYHGLLLLSLLLVGSAGHHGGNLTHGSDFLTQGAPPFIVKIFAKSKTPPPPASTDASHAATNSAPPAVGGNDTSAQKIRAIFESRCYACHGPEKQKGDYRLDLRDRALAAGESGSPGIVPGDPLKSQVVKFLLLPRDHDDAMPPEGKQALTPEEIVSIIHWIQAGAPFEP